HPTPRERVALDRRRARGRRPCTGNAGTGGGTCARSVLAGCVCAAGRRAPVGRRRRHARARTGVRGQIRVPGRGDRSARRAHCTPRRSSGRGRRRRAGLRGRRRPGSPPSGGADVIAVDLLPPDEARAAAARRRARRFGMLGIALAAAGAVSGHGLLAIATAVTGHEVARAEAERAMLQRPVAVLRRLRQRQASLRRRLAILARLEARDGEPARLLAALGLAGRAGLWLTAVKLAGERLELAGVGPGERTVAGV